MFSSTWLSCIMLAVFLASSIRCEENNTNMNMNDNSLPEISVGEFITWAYENMKSDPISISNNTEEKNMTTGVESTPETFSGEFENTTNYDSHEEQSLTPNITKIQNQNNTEVNDESYLVIEKMEMIGIVPHIVPKPPRTVANITYNCMSTEFHVHGNEGEAFADYIMKNAPKVEYECNDTALYTLFMTFINVTDKRDSHNFDPNRMIDAKQHHNWLVYNIPGCKINKGNELFKYEKPTSMDEDEYRIYVFLIFTQNKKFEVDLEERTFLYFFRDQTFHNAHRGHFTIEEFADKYDLGELEAGNYVRQYFPKSSRK